MRASLSPEGWVEKKGRHSSSSTAHTLSMNPGGVAEGVAGVEPSRCSPGHAYSGEPSDPRPALTERRPASTITTSPLTQHLYVTSHTHSPSEHAPCRESALPRNRGPARCKFRDTRQHSQLTALRKTGGRA